MGEQDTHAHNLILAYGPLMLFGDPHILGPSVCGPLFAEAVLGSSLSGLPYCGGPSQVFEVIASRDFIFGVFALKGLSNAFTKENSKL